MANNDQGESVLVIGGGGHAKVVVSLLQALGCAFEGVLDDQIPAGSRAVLGVPVLGPVSMLDTFPDHGAVIAVGDNHARRRIAETNRDRRWLCAVHPTAVVHPSVQIGPGTLVFAGAVIQPDTTIGRHVIVNTGATIDHDCRVGDYSHIGPGTTLAGGVGIGEGTLAGVASAVLPGVAVGNWATLGGGAVVTAPVPSGVTVVGVPARSLGRPTDRTGS
jgi:sugar O-acyltransferase (sialic acid O-acetyltransferase NeuD family)